MKERKISIILASIYFIVLVWIILFKMQFSMANLHTRRNINLVPYGESVIRNGKIDCGEMLDNILIFIPAGIYIAMLKKDWKISKKIGIIAGISLILEVLQYILAIGATDITDLINNTLGGILGLGIYQLFYKIGKTQEKANRILNRLALVGTSFVIVFLGIIIVVN